MRVRIHVLCEGQTEEAFVKELLVPHFISREITLQPALIGKPGHKGGNIKFDRLFLDVRNRLLGDRTAYCTTFFDFYGLDSAFPNKSVAAQYQDVAGKAQVVEAGLTTAVVNRLDTEAEAEAVRRFIPYVQMYEFEALLFSDPANFAAGIYHPHLSPQFQTIRQAFASPEEINDSPQTAPSKRIARLVNGYEKPLMGVLGALAIGLRPMREACPLFNQWLEKLESLSR